MNQAPRTKLPTLLALLASAPLALVPGCSSSSPPDDPIAEGRTVFGALRLEATIPVHDRPFAIQAADLDGVGTDREGTDELLVGGRALTVLSGAVPGELRPLPGTPFPDLIEATDFATADFNGDGLQDIAIAEHDAPKARFVLLLGDRNGGFMAAPGSPFPVDAVPHLHTLAAADFDGDGHQDLVADSWPESELVLVRGRGDGRFHTPGTSFRVPPAPMQNLRTADMNGDGRPDLVVPAHDARAVAVLLGKGDGSFTPAKGSPFRSFGGFSTLALVDMDRDGDPDVVEVHRSDASTEFKVDALSILTNDGEGRLVHAPGSPHRGLPTRSNGFAVADFDGDGWIDVAVLGETDGELAILLGSETGLSLHSTSQLPGRCLGVTAARLDPDGPSHIVVTDYQGARVLIFGLTE